MLCDVPYANLKGYTNADNPFGDEHLLDSFVWHKVRDQIACSRANPHPNPLCQKREHEVSTRNLTEKDVEKEERRRQDEMRRELEKVKKRRLVSVSKKGRRSCDPDGACF